MPPRQRIKKDATDAKADGGEDRFKGLTKDNVLGKLSNPKTSKTVQKLAWEYLDMYIGDVIKSKAFLKLPKAMIATLTKRESLACSELVLFEGVAAWAKEQLKTDKEAKDVKGVLGDILFNIRFPCMETTDIATVVVPAGVLAQEQVLELFTYLAQKDAVSSAKPGKSLAQFNSKPRSGGGMWRALPPVASTPYGGVPTGVFYLIGSSFGKGSHSNPHTSGQIRSFHEPSTTWSGGVDETQLVNSLESGRSNSTDAYLSGSYIGVDLRDYRLQPTHYAMKNGGGRGLVITDWTLEAKTTDDGPWEILRTHTGDGTYQNDGQNGFGLHVFELDKQSKWYKQFVIRRTDGKRTIYIHRWELYGSLKKVSAGAK